VCPYPFPSEISLRDRGRDRELAALHSAVAAPIMCVSPPVP
jgi:hypothetical protein